jgi:hypothetical protein
MAEAIVIGAIEEPSTEPAPSIMQALGEQIQAIILADAAGDTALVEQLRAGYDTAMFLFAGEIEREVRHGKAAAR